jgi:hypothetical protein
VLSQQIGEGFVRQLLNSRHPVAPKLLQFVEGVVVKGDQFAHDRSLPSAPVQWLSAEIVPARNPPSLNLGLNNSGNDPSGASNSAKLAAPPAPGANSAGTTSGDVAIDAEDKAIDRKLKSICRGCQPQP